MTKNDIMILKRLKADGLAQNSYFISSRGEAVVVDPRREAEDVAEIIGMARDQCARIMHVFETHRNEDYVHGSVEIAKKTGATIHHGSNLPFRYGEPTREGDEVSFGGMKIKALETPGHTPESLTYVLYDEKDPGEPMVAFTGDALFVGSTGRVDLAPGGKEANARMLYGSIHEKIVPLGDQVLLCPAHGAGSVCGVGLADRDWSTLGYEKQTNQYLQMNRDEFIKAKLDEKLTRPPYFSTMEQYNLDGPPSLTGRTSPVQMGFQEFKGLVEKDDYELIDTRMPASFGGGHIPGSYSIWLGGTALFPGWLFGPGQKLLLLADRDGDALAADKYLCRIGYDHVEGFLCGGFEEWQNSGLPITHTGEMSVDALKMMLDEKMIALLDVRGPEEWEEGIVPGAKLIYVGHLKGRLKDMPKDKPIAVMCSVGRRGSLGASILQKAGFSDVYNVLGGYTAWNNKGYPSVKPPV